MIQAFDMTRTTKEQWKSIVHETYIYVCVVYSIVNFIIIIIIIINIFCIQIIVKVRYINSRPKLELRQKKLKCLSV